MNHKEAKAFITNKYINRRWIAFLVIAFMFYLSCAVSIKASGMFLNIPKFILSTASIFTIGILVFVFYYRNFIYTLQIQNNKFIYSNILTKKIIPISEIILLDIDIDKLRVWIVYGTDKDNPAKFSYGLVDIRNNYAKLQSIMKMLQDISDAKVSPRYIDFLSLNARNTEEYMQSYEKSDICIYATYFVMVLRSTIPVLFVLILLLYMGTVPEVFPIESYFISNGIFMFLEVIILFINRLTFKKASMTIAEAKKRFRNISLIRYLIFFVSLLIGALYLLNYSGKMLSFAIICSALFYLQLYYMTIGMFRTSFKNALNKMQS